MPTYDQISQKAFHVGRPNIPNKEKLLQRFEQVIENHWLTNMGPLSLELEKKIASYLGVKHCICVCNGTIGLELLQRALGLTGEVIIPAFTFIATAHSLRWQRIKPVFCDVNPTDHLINVDQVEGLITPQTSAIMGVHLWGQPCDVKRLQAIANKHDIKLIFDSAHAFACQQDDQYIGNFGDAEVFSFHATKFFSTAEGGAIVTNNDELAKKLWLMRNFGFSNMDTVNHIGSNAKMSELSAAYGLVAFDEIPEILHINHQNYLLYLDAFKNFPNIKFLQYPNSAHNNYQYVIAEVDKQHRNKLFNFYHDKNIFVRRYFSPGCHRMEPYQTDPFYTNLQLPITEKLADTCLAFPTGKSVNKCDIETFAELYRKFCYEN